MYKVFFILTLSLFFIFSLSASSALAADCTIIYGGGQMNCPTPTPTPVHPTFANNMNQTKGGLPVYNTSNAQTTPGTGPEMFGLISLIPAAGAGFWLKRKTK